MDQKKNNFDNQYFTDHLHRLGRITLIVATLLLLGIPLFIGGIYGVSIDWRSFWNGFYKVAIIYVPVSVVEFFVYAPMLGVGGSYLAFLTGNIANMKLPCAMNARDICKTKVGTPEHEIISTLSVATSALVTMLVLLVGVLLLVPLTPILENPVLTPAFDMVVPALFGTLGLKYFCKSLKITAVPLLAMILLCILVPTMITQTSILIIPAGGLALVISFVLYKKNLL